MSPKPPNKIWRNGSIVWVPFPTQDRVIRIMFEVRETLLLYLFT